MNELEAVQLARYVRALCPQQKFDEYTADVWGDVLADYDFDACKQAAIALGRRQPFIAPAELIDEVQRQRIDRLHAFQYEPGDGDDDPLEYLRRLRSQIAAVAEGRRAPALPTTGTTRPMAELAAQIAASTRVPAEPTDTDTRIRTALDVACPACKAGPRRACTSRLRGRRLGHYHPSRIDASKES